MANSATSPGNVLLLALVMLVVGSPVRALGVVFIAAAVVLVLALRKAAVDRGLPGWTGVITAALVGMNPLLLSTVGLEMTLAAALLAALLASVTGSRPVVDVGEQFRAGMRHPRNRLPLAVHGAHLTPANSDRARTSGNERAHHHPDGLVPDIRQRRSR